MKGAYVISPASNLYAAVSKVLVGLGAETREGVTQIRDEAGNLFTVFADLDPEVGMDWQEPPTAVCSSSLPPHPDTATACWVECRSEESFVRWMRLIAAALVPAPWVIDSDGVAWTAGDIDPRKIKL